ncbi:hypothetical protein BS17DRAFT_696468 [Gyrodon lividus]|nr:hypothetical protein BS17DRAFT_696468 [Gyrodon lividus]
MLDRSPATEPPVSDHDVIIEDDENNWSLKRRSVEVDSMEVGAESVSPPRARKRRRQQVYVLVPPPPPLVKKIIEKMKMKEREMAEAMVSGSEIEEEDDELRYNQLEQRVIEESKSRLMERRCRWLNCEAILNCTNNLLAHLKKHASEESPQAPLLCHWAGCRRKIHTIEERDVHLERHAVLPLPCPLAGCNEEFDRPIEVMQHEVQHQDDGRSLVHKPTSEPFVPPMPARLGQPPRYLPSYRVLPRRILKSRISADRHAVMGPWVLWNIFSPVDLNMRKQNATMRGRPTRQGSNYNTKDLDARHDDYDFLVPLTSHSAKVPALDDLNSDLVTQLASRGLTLWGPQPPLHNPAESPPSAEPQNDESAPLAVNIAMSDSATGEGNTTLIDVEGNTTISDVVTPPSRNIATEPTTSQLIGATGEEEAVERMLIL